MVPSGHFGVNCIHCMAGNDPDCWIFPNPQGLSFITFECFLLKSFLTHCLIIGYDALLDDSHCLSFIIFNFVFVSKLLKLRRWETNIHFFDLVIHKN